MIGGDILIDCRIDAMRSELRYELVQTLLKFFEYHCGHVLKNGENLHATAGFVEQRRVLKALSAVYPELEEQVRIIDAGLDRLLVTGRKQLLEAYLRSQDPEEVLEISETLGQIISAGKWPEWQMDFDLAIEERCSAPSIAPKLAG
jgi:hypothetical protein